MNIFEDLIKLARERKDQPLEGSYTNKLLKVKSSRKLFLEFQSLNLIKY